MPKFTIEEHEKRMRELLTPKPEEGKGPLMLKRLLEAARLKTREKPIQKEER